jgi:hypothetical protein
MAHTKIAAPTREINDPLYPSDCQAAVADYLVELADRAAKAGWDHKVVHYSLMMAAAQLVRKHSNDGPPEADAR